jgi:hypothetical protein
MKTTEISPLMIARLAGLLYLLVVPLGIFGLYVQSKLIVSANIEATATNIMANESLFRLGIVSDMLAPIILIVVVTLLYYLFKPVNKFLALLMVLFVLVGTPISMLNKLNQFATIQLLSGADYLKVFTTEQILSLTHLFLRLFSQGNTIAFIFWGLWLFPLGYLVFKSGFMPKVLGILLMISCFGYVVNSFGSLLGYTINIGMFSALGELLFILWLLIKGVNTEKWKMLISNSS